MKIKKILAVFACSAILLSACGKNQPVETKAEETTASEIKNETTEATAAETPAAAEETTEEASREDYFVNFETTDLDGNACASEDFRDKKVIMLNFWEPWCGPCVGEMPELEQLYENYKDEGFLILGIYSTEGDDDSVRAIIEDNGITYPILRMTEALSPFETGYVPTTGFIDGDGRLISEGVYVGAKSYEDWEQILKSYLK